MMTRRSVCYCGILLLWLGAAGPALAGGTPDTFTIGGAIYSSLEFPLVSGIEGVTVTVDGPGGPFVATTGAFTGLWQVADLPVGRYTVMPSLPGTCFQHVVGGVRVGNPPITIEVNLANQAANQSLQFWSSCDDGDPCTVDDCVNDLCTHDPACAPGEACDPTSGMCMCSSAAACADLDGNGIRDDGCAWTECAAGACGAVDVPFADMGGPFGACFPDGVVDLNDKFHALLCLQDLDTTGATGYPCDRVNVDAGGPFGDCCPDGICDLHDAMHALNVLQGFSACACPDACGGPAPELPLGATQRTRLIVVPRSPALVARGTVVVDVFAVDPIGDLRGYQIQLAVSGGRRGHLLPVAATLLARPDAAFAGQPGRFSATNPSVQLAAAGLDGVGVAVPAGAYLATFTYLVSPDAEGRFVLDIADDVASGGRTGLIAFPDRPVRIEATTPARVVIGGKTRSRR